MTAVVELTVPAVTVKVAEVCPCATVTEAGTVAAEVLELDSDTETPPLPAADVKVTVPVAVPPLAIVLELTERLLSAGGGGLTVTPKVLLTLEYEAVKVTDVAELTVPAVTVKVAEVWPWATVTEAGTLAAELLELESATAMPPLPAADVRVTVPVAVPPLAIVLELTDRLLSAGGGGLTVTPKVLLTLEYEAVKVTDVAELTVPAVTVKVAEVWPWATVTEAGTLAAELLELESATAMPPLPAADVSVTVPVAVPALAIVEELTDRLLSAGAGGLTVTPKVLLTLEYEAVKVTDVAELDCSRRDRESRRGLALGHRDRSWNAGGRAVGTRKRDRDAAAPCGRCQGDRARGGAATRDGAGVDRKTAQRWRCWIDGDSKRFVNARVGGGQGDWRCRTDCSGGYREGC